MTTATTATTTVTTSTPQTLRDILAAFQAQRATTMDPAALAENIRQRSVVTAAADKARFVQAGQKLAPFSLQDVKGGVLQSDALLAEGPVLLIFFRFEGCPVCNIALPHYDRALTAALAAQGIRLIAVSPQQPDRLGAIATRHDLQLTVASDPDNRLARALGITFSADETAQAIATAKGTPLPAITGASNWDLPMPAAILIDQNAVVAFAEVTPDWLDRSAAGDLLAAAHSLLTPA